MKFEEAISHINRGFKMRSAEWGSERHFSLVNDDSDLNAIRMLDLDDINSEWEHFGAAVKAKDLSFYQAMEYMDMKYKTARRSWNGKCYFRENIMYLQHGKELYDKEYSCLSIDDVRANDWIALK